MNFILLLLVLLYSFTLWLGLYLIQRNWRKGYLRMAGLGLVSYAVALGFRGLILISPEDGNYLALLYQFSIYQPALFWAGGLLHLLPEQSSARGLLPFYLYGQILITELLILFNLFGIFPSWAVMIVVGIPIFLYLIILIYEQNKFEQRGRLSLAFVGTIFFGLSIGLFIPNDIFPEIWLVLAMGFDLILLGLGIAVHDAFQEGHSLRLSMWHSFQNAFFVSLLIGGQVALVILGLGVHLILIASLLGLLATGVVLVTFGPNLFFSRTASIIESSERNIDQDIDFSDLPDKDFFRYTRRALSYLDDLPKLASNPLTQLPVIKTRLVNRNTHIDTLSLANELKIVLMESIHQLKPATDSAFGTTDEWRYYNALYFPYVAGIKPSRRRQTKENLADYEIEALEWFRREVPERTLYNWQNKAAELIAISLKEKL